MTSSSGYSPGHPEMHRNTDLSGIIPNLTECAGSCSDWPATNGLPPPVTAPAGSRTDHRAGLAGTPRASLQFPGGPSERFLLHRQERTRILPSHSGFVLPLTETLSAPGIGRRSLSVSRRIPKNHPKLGDRVARLSSPSALIRERRRGPDGRVGHPSKKVTCELIPVPGPHRPAGPCPRRGGLHHAHPHPGANHSLDPDRQGPARLRADRHR